MNALEPEVNALEHEVSDLERGVNALELEDLVMHFGPVRAVDGVSLQIRQGTVVALVGESGSGKSTVGRCIVRLLEPTGGTVRLADVDITHLSRRQLRPHRRNVSIVFQDPAGSLDPRFSVGDIVSEPLRLMRRPNSRAAVAEALRRVGLRPEVAQRAPHELSGGQRQRVSIARALISEPRLLVADEPTSALDVSVQASVLNLLADLQRDLGFACLFITHDLSAVEYLADEVAVMYLGQLVEQGPRERIFGVPAHPYTQALLSAAPVPDPAAQRGRRPGAAR
ncbi:ATP-binding cassette domain-containing protein [Kribbella qitaiheensis]|uniref:ATP-binding cassette domain-containing protein n=1 Tax=Kribbella qitaiheensis TaxID=1544730 RepID=UPI001FE4DFE7|nr:ABC transporter ATP-binding protein [Kribbella qitaiheensis]